MSHPPPALSPNLRDRWMLKPGVVFLNHGSFGAMPRVVFEAQNSWREKIEAEPIEMIGRRMQGFIDAAKNPVAEQFGMKPGDFGFVTNATDGVNAVLRSISLKPGDEVLTTDHVYGAVRQAMKLVARNAGASYRAVPIPLPIESADQIRDGVLNSVTDQTRLLVIDHVTSPSGLVFPVEQIVAGCRERGVDVLVDGAHVPGMLPLDVEKIGATYYAANLHKWVCAPKGTAFLWVAPERQSMIHPNVISHHLDEGFTKEFGWQGTRDFSTWLSAPAAIDFLHKIGFEKVMRHNHAMAVWAHQMLVDAWGVHPISPLDGSLLGSMATVPLPSPLDEMDTPVVEQFQQRLYSEFGIEVPLVRWGGRTMLRVSCHLHNEPEDYQHLAATIRKLAIR